MADALSCQRHRFSLADGSHYLNCAYMGPLPRVAQEAGVAAIARKGDPSGIGPSDFFEDSDGARRRFASIIGADPARIALVPAASYGIATVAHNTRLEAGQRIVMLAEQFPSNVYAWRRLAARHDAEVVTVAAPASAQRGAGWNEALLGAIDQRTALVALPHVHWTDGTRFDLEAVGARAREVGAALVIDGTQSIGALPFDVARIRPDAVVCAAYKWLLGPYAIGFAYYGDRYLDGEPLEETWIARRDSDDFRGLVNYRDDYGAGAVRFDVGERSNFILVAMANAALDLVGDWGADRIQEYCRHLTGELLEEAAALGFGIEDADRRAAHLFGLRMPSGIDLEELQRALRARAISVSLRGSALRVAPNVYNDAEDVGALLDVLRAAVSRRGTSAAASSAAPAASASAR
jgi:selenocysteine lyase/cysteine desulfurase